MNLVLPHTTPSNALGSVLSPRRAAQIGGGLGLGSRRHIWLCLLHDAGFSPGPESRANLFALSGNHGPRDPTWRRVNPSDGVDLGKLGVPPQMVEVPPDLDRTAMKLDQNTDCLGIRRSEDLRRRIVEDWEWVYMGLDNHLVEGILHRSVSELCGIFGIPLAPIDRPGRLIERCHDILESISGEILCGESPSA